MFYYLIDTAKFLSIEQECKVMTKRKDENVRISHYKSSTFQSMPYFIAIFHQFGIYYTLDENCLPMAHRMNNLD